MSDRYVAVGVPWDGSELVNVKAFPTWHEAAAFIIDQFVLREYDEIGVRDAESDDLLSPFDPPEDVAELPLGAREVEERESA